MSKSVGPHEWCEPLSHTTFCVNCGALPWTHSDLERCPAAGRGLLDQDAADRWDSYVASGLLPFTPMFAVHFVEIRKALAAMN